MAKLIGTAGHVDHGKTSLIQALTGIDTDRLPEEKRRGMTIDIGFAYFELPGVGKVSIVDVPGHEKFLTNMLVGALGIDVALLCVAADESVMPQTREHFQIIDLLPVDRMVVALTKSDLADSEFRELARAEVEELLAPTRFSGSKIVEVSSKTGEGIEDLRLELARQLSTPGEAAIGPWFLPIDRVFTVKGHGTVVTGTLAGGKVSEGDKAVVEPGHLDVRIRAIQWHDEDQDHSEAGRRTALNLAGPKVEALHRGQAVGAPGALFETTIFDAKVRWINAPKHALRVRVSIGAAEVIGKLFLSDLEPELAQIRLEQPVAVALDQPLIIRRYSPPDLLGGGRVIVPNAVLRKKSEAVRVADSSGSDADRILSVTPDAPEGLTTDEICRLLGKAPQALGDAFEQLKREGRLLGFAGLWMTPTSFEAASSRLTEAISRLHEASPAKAYVSREQAVTSAGFSWTGKPLDRIVAAMVEGGRLRSNGTEVALADFRVKLSERQRALLDRVAEVLDRNWPNVPGPKEIAQAISTPIQAVDEILRVGLQAKEVVRIAEDVFYTHAGIARFQEAARAVSTGKPFPASAFRDSIGTTRKYAIPILEYLDSIRFTIRVGDERSVVG